ncbi:hypothetical protein J3R83DRAFT_682 [Lanmaoa asiatica]|nr:hypothetical protein J3R83DRAFT_682 [Lanmaoa asiatica]
MPSKFNIVRASLYAVVLAWTIICLAIAAHFQSLLVITDLTRFVPFALFVCSASLLILLVLLVCSALRNRNPISTRIELGCLGLLGTFWLGASRCRLVVSCAQVDVALGAFLASSDSENADVECFSSVDSSQLVDVAGCTFPASLLIPWKRQSHIIVSTETYQAQYRVLEAFSLFNVILVWGFLLFLLGMALKHYYRVNRNVWFIPVTAYPWFGPRSSYIFVFCLSGAVLGLAGNFAELFLPNINHDFTIFSLVVPSTTIFAFFLLLQFAQPIIEVTVHFLLGFLWLGEFFFFCYAPCGVFTSVQKAMGAWSADIIGYVQCYGLAGQTRPTKNGMSKFLVDMPTRSRKSHRNGNSVSAEMYCYEMKAIEALSWAIFVMFVFFFLIVVTLATRAVALGRVYAWREHITQLGWFGEWPAYPTEAVRPRGPPYAYGPYSYAHGVPAGGNYVQQAPGHSVVIQPGVNGAPAMITQVPGIVSPA